MIFTSGATAGIKLVAESFVFTPSPSSSSSLHSPTPNVTTLPCDTTTPTSSSTSDDIKNTTAVNTESHTADDVCRGALCYLADNHTSIIGMREVVRQKGVALHCLPDIPDKYDIRPQGMTRTCTNNHLFVFPAQSNFSGRKYPLSWIDTVHVHGAAGVGCNKNWCVLLDAAGYVATSQLDLNAYSPDFVPISFYKMFGFPTGLGINIFSNNMYVLMSDALYYTNAAPRKSHFAS